MKIGEAPFLRSDLLDLESVNLYGWEHLKSRTKVNVFADALGAGCVFPEVAVIEVSDTSFCLVSSINRDDGLVDGGHHRAVAHLQLGINLPVAVLYRDRRHELEGMIRIHDIELI